MTTKAPTMKASDPFGKDMLYGMPITGDEARWLVAVLPDLEDIEHPEVRDSIREKAKRVVETYQEDRARAEAREGSE